jgi:hypothetical protein
MKRGVAVMRWWQGVVGLASTVFAVGMFLATALVVSFALAGAWVKSGGYLAVAGFFWSLRRHETTPQPELGLTQGTESVR